MPANTNPIFIATRQCWAAELDDGDTTAKVALVAAGSNGSLVESITATTTDTTAVEMDLFLYDGSASFALGSVTIAAGAGTDGGTTGAVDILNQTDLPWLRDDLTLGIESGYTLQVACHATMTASKVTHVTAWGGDY